MANLDAIVKELQQERDRLGAAIKALSSLTGSTQARSNQPRRTFSAAARRRMAAAQKARWAKVKGQQKVVPIAQAGKAGKRTMSAAARRKIAAAQRARWARIKVGKK